jgi:inner membrane protein
MPTVFAHAVVASAVCQILPAASRSLRFRLLSVFCAVLPDADVIAFDLGIPYEHPLGHRGLSHSLLVAAVVGLVAAVPMRQGVSRRRSWLRVAAFFTAVTASHGLLDAMTDGGLGVALFAPFDSDRYFLAWRPILVSPIGLTGFLSTRGAATLRSELVWIWLPSLFFVGLLAALRRGRRRRP